MNPYLLVPLLSALACAAFAAAILLIGPRQLSNRLAAGLVAGGAWWGGAEVLAASTADPDVALALLRIGSLGWLFTGPLAFHLWISLSVLELPAARRVVRPAYAIGLAFLAVGLGSGALIREVQPYALPPLAAGWAVVPGPLFPVALAFMAATIGLAIGIWMRDRGRGRAPWSRHSRVPWALTSIGALFALSTVVDGLLPLVGVPSPRVGMAAMAAVGAHVLWYLQRFGYSRLSPVSFSSRVLQTLPDGIALVHPNGRIRLANERMAALLGCSLAETEGLSMVQHLDFALLDPPRELREVPTELEPLTGRPIPVTLSAAPLLDDTSALLGVIVVVRDERELTALRDRLVVSDRMVALGQLAAGIAHEINNPLAFVRANLQHMRREWGQVSHDLGEEGLPEPVRVVADEWQELLAESLDGIDRAATIVRDVKAFSHTGPSDLEPADLNDLLDQVVRVADPQLGDGVRVETSYGLLPKVPCSSQHLQQLFLNLVVNAAQAIEGEGVVRITTQKSADSVIATVEDDGCGISADVLERIFDPFFTTKSVGQGSGLGLSICYEIVRSHDGEIWVDSEIDRGSAFHVRLPLEGPAAPASDPAA